MAKKNFYAVKKGKIPGIYTNWDDAQKQVIGFQGAIFKGFITKEEAEAFMDEKAISISAMQDNIQSEQFIESLNSKVEKEISNLDESSAIAFVDGSYDPKNEIAGYGVIVFTKDNGKESFYRSFCKDYSEDVIKERNIFAELEGAQTAISYAIEAQKNKIKLYYDYEGIGAWAENKWKAKSQSAKKYFDFVKSAKLKIELDFEKIPAHSGITLNEEADALAKSSLNIRGYKSYKDGSVFFVGFSTERWKSIIESLNEENENLSGDKMLISVEEKIINDYRSCLTVTSGLDKLFINCYRENKSYVQGKQSVIFQRLIASAIDLLSSSVAVIDTLNRYHALTIDQEKTEDQFKIFVPNFDYTNDNLIYNVLLSAAYNTMFTGYMPDYTCLVTPIFRAYEYYLHKSCKHIPGVKTTVKGRSKFSLFDKDNRNSNCYVLKARYKGVLTSNQEKYIEDLYSKYNNIRHPYSHWASADYASPQIVNISDARKYIEEGFELIRQYYINF